MANFRRLFIPAVDLDDVAIGTDRSEERRKRISILLTILALLLWSHSIICARFEIGHWGLLNGLPVTFFIALALLTIASAILWASKEKHGQLLCLQLVILVVALALVPIITGGSIPFINHGYRNIGYVDYIVRQGHFDTQVTFYLSWPGAFVLSAIIANIGSIDFGAVIEALPFLLPLLALLPLYVFLKNILGEERINYVWAGCWLYSVAGWGGPGNLISAGGTAMFFFLLVTLALVTNPRIWHKEGSPFPIILLIVITFTAMAISHVLTALAALGIIAGLALVRQDRRLVLTSVICFAVLLTWNLTVAGDYIIERLPFISEGGLIFDLSLLTEREITGHFLGSSAHVDVNIIKLVHAGLFVLIGLAGGISSLVMRKDLKTTFSLLAILIIPLPLVVLSGYYAEEILRRLYGFVMPGLAYFGAILFRVNKKVVAVILCLLLIIAIPTKMISAYGNQELDYFSPAQRVGTFFFHDVASQGLVVGAWPIGEVENIENYGTFDLDALRWHNNQLVVPDRFKEYLPYYIGISRQDEAYYGWFLGEEDFIADTEKQLKDTENTNFIYSNPDLVLYICEGD